MNRQLVFDLPQRVARNREAFLVAPCNAQAVDVIDNAAQWTQSWTQPVQWLYGPAGCGKTHLAAVLAADYDALHIDAAYMTADSFADLFDGSAQPEVVIVDRLEKMPKQAQEALFHLLNHARHAELRVLLLSRQPAAQLPIDLPDLVSRLKALAAIEMQQPDDKVMYGLLDKLFTDRQINVEARVIDYMVPRISRDFAAMGALVSALDAAALANKKPITVPFVAQFLDQYVADA